MCVGWGGEPQMYFLPSQVQSTYFGREGEGDSLIGLQPFCLASEARELRVSASPGLRF